MLLRLANHAYQALLTLLRTQIAAFRLALAGD